MKKDTLPIKKKIVIKELKDEAKAQAKKPKPKAIDISEKSKPSIISASPSFDGINVSASPSVKLGKGKLRGRITESLTGNKLRQSADVDFETKKGAMVGVGADTDKNIRLRYSSPQGAFVSGRYSKEGGPSIEYSSPGGLNASVGKNFKALSYTTKKGATIGGNIDIDKNVTAEYSSPKGRYFSASYMPSEKEISGSYASKRGSLIGARYNLQGKRGEVTASIPIRKKKK